MRLVPALVLAVTFAVAGSTHATATTTIIPPLPACTYQDVPAALGKYADWNRTLLDPTYMVYESYVPPDLVYASNAGITGGGKVRSLATADLAAMTAAAKAAGKPIATNSAYRSYATQESLFWSDVSRLGYNGALLHTARPGHSEHQLGTTIDFKSKKSTDGSPDGDWANSKAGRWMKNNAWKYGWVMSYPKDKTSVTCYAYEPWHYRYVGRSTAAAVVSSGLTLREWLWYQGYGVPQSSIMQAPAA